MILVDTSIWVDHLRTTDEGLQRLLNESVVLGHPWVTGELSLGRLAARQEILGLMGSLPQATVVTPAELLSFVKRHDLMGRGVGYVDVQLLAATRVTPGASLWTRDRRLGVLARQLGVATSSTLQSLQ